MKKILAFIIVFCLSGIAIAQKEPGEKQVDRVEAAGDVLSDIMQAPDNGIPEDLLASAKCIAVVPSMLKGGFMFGGAYGRGIASCRTETGAWSAPVFIGMTGGSFGLQIGGQAVDYVMLIMNERGMNNLLSSKFKLGADTSAAAGPVGRLAEGSTDWQLRAQVLTYSRARGLFAGISLNGAVIKQDASSTRAFYGKTIPFRKILRGGVPVPESAEGFLATLTKYARNASTTQPANSRQMSQERSGGQ